MTLPRLRARRAGLVRVTAALLVPVDQLLGPAPPTGVLIEHQPGQPGPAGG